MRIRLGGWSGLELTDTLEGHLIVEIIKVKPGLDKSKGSQTYGCEHVFFKLSKYVLVFTLL